MAGMMMKVLCVMVACMVLSAPYTEAITCAQVLHNTVACLSYLRGVTDFIPANCCRGVVGLNSAARTTADKKFACACFRSYKNLPNIKPDLFAVLPAKCGVSNSMPYFSITADCTKIELSGLCMHLDS